MQGLNRRLERTGTGTARHLLFVGTFSLLFLLASIANAQEDCIDCHNPNGVPTPHDPVCQETSCLQSCHAKDLNQLWHPAGPGTPLTGDRTTTCRTCHDKPFPGVYHPYTINVNAGSVTPPGTADLDQACGQCHGGGDNSTTNPPAPNAAYLNKTELGTYAKGIHHDTPNASFGYVFAVPDSLVVNVDASGSTCTNGCDAYEWNWGDGTAPTTGVTASHTYAPGTFTITLTVKDNGVGTGSVAHQVIATAPDDPPVVEGTACESILNANTWTATLEDASIDAPPGNVKQVTVTWGDGSGLASDTTAPFGPFSRTYLNAGAFTITHKAIDNAGQQSSRSCMVSPAYFAIGGTVYRSNGTTAVPSATVQVRKGTTVRTVYTASNGTFSVGSLKPGTYTLTVTKSGYTFPVPAATITIGPSSSGNSMNATSP